MCLYEKKLERSKESYKSESVANAKRASKFYCQLVGVTMKTCDFCHSRFCHPATSWHQRYANAHTLLTMAYPACSFGLFVSSFTCVHVCLIACKFTRLTSRVTVYRCIACCARSQWLLGSLPS